MFGWLMNSALLKRFILFSKTEYLIYCFSYYTIRRTVQRLRISDYRKGKIENGGIKNWLENCSII